MPPILLFIVGIFFIWAWEDVEDTIYAVMAFAAGGYYLYRAIKRNRALKQPAQGAAKIEQVAAKIMPKGGKGKAKPKKSTKKFVIIGIIIIVAAIIIAAIFYFSGSDKRIEFKGEAEWTFDFPVSSLRNGDVTLVRQEEYFSDASAKYTVVANTGDQPQDDIKIFEYLPPSMAQSLDDIECDLEPEVISQADPVVLKFTIDELGPQKSVVIKIASRKGVKDAEQTCADVGVSDCQENFQEIAQDAEQRSRDNYQSDSEPVTSVYVMGETDASVEQNDFFSQVLAESKNLISQARYEPVQSSESDGGFIAKIKEFIAQVSEAVKTYQTGETEEERAWGNLPPPQSTALDQNWFPQQITQVWILSETREAEVSQSLCGGAPLKTMFANYVIPEKYRGGLTASQQTSQVVEISAYPTFKDARMAAQDCGDNLLRRDSGIPHALYWVNLSMDYTAYSAGLPNRVIAAIDNYIVSVKLKTGAGGWSEYMMKDTVFPAFIEQMRSQY